MPSPTCRCTTNTACFLDVWPNSCQITWVTNTNHTVSADIPHIQITWYNISSKLTSYLQGVIWYNFAPCRVNIFATLFPNLETAFINTSWIKLGGLGTLGGGKKKLGMIVTGCHIQVRALTDSGLLLTITFSWFTLKLAAGTPLHSRNTRGCLGPGPWLRHFVSLLTLIVYVLQPGAVFSLCAYIDF